MGGESNAGGAPATEALDGIAVIGMAGRFPGAADLRAFWKNLREGVEAIARFTDEELRAAGESEERLRDPNYVRACAHELLALWEQAKPTVIFVTHDLEEAIALADQVVVMTVGPGTVKAVYDIDLPRPRGAVQEIRFDPRFLELHHHIWESLREEVERAYARTAKPTSANGGQS